MGDLIRPHNRWSPSYDEKSPFLVGKSQWLVTNLQEMNRKATTLKQYMSILDNINMVYIYILAINGGLLSNMEIVGTSKKRCSKPHQQYISMLDNNPPFIANFPIFFSH